jgi:hypothetical protein
LKALLILLAMLVAGGAAAQERKRLEMPAGFQNPDSGPPPGLSAPGPGSPKVIASSSDQPAPKRPPTVDIYNNITRSTWDQIKAGRYGDPEGSDQLARENRWIAAPLVGVVVQTPIGARNAEGNAPASIGFNAGPQVRPDGTVAGTSVTGRIRMPFGR